MKVTYTHKRRNDKKSHSFFWSDTAHTPEHAYFVTLKYFKLSLSRDPCVAALNHKIAYTGVIYPALGL